MKTIPIEIQERIENLQATIRGCNEALAANLEAWERKEFKAVLEEAAAELTQKHMAIAMHLK
jgi:hypothetical protein